MTRVNIFHEWLDTSGGAESVLSKIVEYFPNSKIYTLWAEPQLVEKLGINVRVSFLQFFPRRFRRTLGLPLMPIAWKLLGRNIKSEDISITSSWVFCHTAIPKRYEANSFHYIHTPARYWWNPEIDVRSEIEIPFWVLSVLRKFDKWMARNHQNLIANSESTRNRIRNFWGLESFVLYPPVDVEFFNYEHLELNENQGKYLLCVGRFVPYKGHELVIQLGEKLNLPVVLAGHGQGELRLRKLAAKSSTQVTLIINPTREKIRELYVKCASLVFPAIEDFGIVPVEAMACGARVLGVNQGGLVDSVIHGESGFLVSNLEIESFVNGFHDLPITARESVRASSLRFAEQNFSIQLDKYLREVFQK